MIRHHSLWRWAGVILFLLLFILLGACTLRSDEPCSEAELVSPTDPSPFGTVVNSLTPVLNWSYPDPTCHPDHYAIEIYDRDVIAWPPHYSATLMPIHSGETVADETNYSVPASAGLQPGQTYFVKVQSRTADDRGTYSNIWWFSTGPSCPAGTTLQGPELIYPPDGETLHFPDTVDLEWRNRMSCWPAGDFYLQISRSADFSAPIWYGVTHNKSVIWITNGPPMFNECTRYYWRVRAQPAGGGEGPYSETRSFMFHRTEVPCPLVIDESHLPGVDIPYVRLLSDANCRSGPTMDFPLLDVLVQGGEYEIQARNTPGDSWMVFDPTINDVCWVHADLVEVLGDASVVEIIDPVPPESLPPTETAAPFNCAQYNNDQPTCSANPACKWDPNNSPNSPCVNK